MAGRGWQNRLGDDLPSAYELVEPRVGVFLLLVVITGLDFHIDHVESGQFILILESLDIILRSLEVWLIHLHSVHLHLNLVVLLQAISVHLVEVRFSSVFEIFDDGKVVVEAGWNWRLNLRILVAHSRFQKTTHWITLNRAASFPVLLQIILDLHNDLFGGLLDNVVFWNTGKCTLVFAYWPDSWGVLRFHSLIRRSAPNSWLVLGLQSVSVQDNRICLFVIRHILSSFFI